MSSRSKKIPADVLGRWSLQPNYKEKLKALQTMERLDAVNDFNDGKFEKEEEVEDGGEVRNG
jgi:hypothetical protein